MKKLKENVELALRHPELTQTATIIWVFLAVCRGKGLGAPKIADQLEIPEPEVRVALAELKRAGLVDVSVGKFRAQPFMLGTELPEAQEEDSPTPMRVVIDAMYGLYNARRQGVGLPPLHRSAKVNRQLTELAEFLNSRGWKFEEYLTFAEKNVGFLENCKYPPFNILIGDWLREKYTQPYKVRSRHAQEATPIAGDTRVTRMSPVDLRKALVDAGIRTAQHLSKDNLRYIQDWADNMLEDPQSFPEPDPEFAPEIEWVYQAALKQRGDE